MFSQALHVDIGSCRCIIIFFSKFFSNDGKKCTRLDQDLSQLRMWCNAVALVCFYVGLMKDEYNSLGFDYNESTCQ